MVSPVTRRYRRWRDIEPRLRPLARWKIRRVCNEWLVWQYENGKYKLVGTWGDWALALDWAVRWDRGLASIGRYDCAPC
jgi:hypothetical protein